MNKVMKDILGRFKELQFFMGESLEEDGMIGLLEYREIDGDSVPVLMFFKHGLIEEKFQVERIRMQKRKNPLKNRKINYTHNHFIYITATI